MLQPAWRKTLKTITWLGGHQPFVLAGLLLIVAGTWGFIELADEVFEAETQTLDRAILMSLRDPQNPADPWGPSWLEEAMRDLTALGGVAVVLLMILFTSGFLWMEKKYFTMVFVLAATLSGVTASLLLKELFARPRPDLVPHLARVYTSSFPSGHAMMSAVVYLTLGALLTRVATRPTVKLYLMLVAMLLTGLIGFSRVYLGVHYPTDVLAGWTAGLVWATACWLFGRYLGRHGAIEPEAGKPAERAHS